MKLRTLITRTLITFAIALLAGLAGNAAEPATATSPSARAFASAPQNIFPLLERNTRLDMIDYAVNGLSTPSANELNGQSTITEITPMDLTVKMSDSSSAQLCVLTAGKDSVIMVISTVAAPGLDSSLSAYDMNWRPLAQGSYFNKPGWKEWLAPGADEGFVTSMTPFMLASYRIDPATGTLTLTNNLKSFLDADTYSMVADQIRPSLTYVWNGRRFNRK